MIDTDLHLFLPSSDTPEFQDESEQFLLYYNEVRP